MLRGRLFAKSENAGSQLVAIVSRKIRKRLRHGMPETATPSMAAVGEVDDVKMRSPDEVTIAASFIEK